MIYVIQLCFSEADRAKLSNIFLRLDSPLILKGDRPHLTLLVFRSMKEEPLKPILEHFAQGLRAFLINIESVGCFSPPGSVVFLAPVVTIHLLTLHQRLFSLLMESGIEPSPLYSPDRWVPHVGITMESEEGRWHTLHGIFDQPVFGDHLLSYIELIRVQPAKLLHRITLEA